MLRHLAPDQQRDFLASLADSAESEAFGAQGVERDRRRLSIERHPDDPPADTGMVRFSFAVLEMPGGGSDDTGVMEVALRRTHGLGIGQLFVRDGELFYEFAVNEEAETAATADALSQAASLAASIGLSVRQQLQAEL